MKFVDKKKFLLTETAASSESTRLYFLKNKTAQSMMEYMLLIGIVTMVLFAMFNACKRGIQSVIKVTADQVGIQNESDQRIVPYGGYLMQAYSATRSNTNKSRKENSGAIDFIYNDSGDVISNSVSNLGFSNTINADN